MTHNIRYFIFISEKLKGHDVFARFPTIKQFIKFAIVGVSSGALDFSNYYFLTRQFDFFEKHYLIANFISFLIAVTWSFVANKYWSFKNNDVHFIKQYPKFFSVYAIGFGANQTILFSMVALLNVHDIISKAIATITVMFWNFFTNKNWTFKNKS